MALFRHSSFWSGSEPVEVWVYRSSAVLLPGLSLDQWLLLCPSSGPLRFPIQRVWMSAFYTKAKLQQRMFTFTANASFHPYFHLNMVSSRLEGHLCAQVCAPQTPWIFTSWAWIWWFKKCWLAWLSFSAWIGERHSMWVWHAFARFDVDVMPIWNAFYL